jgi:hypothetical protein
VAAVGRCGCEKTFGGTTVRKSLPETVLLHSSDG